MEITDVVNLISTIGFPIVAYLLLLKSLEKERDLHKEEVDNLRVVIENNNTLLQKVLTILDKE